MTELQHKPCARCGGPIYRKPLMGPKHFEQRKYCSNSCGNLAARAARAAAPKLPKEPEGSHKFGYRFDQIQPVVPLSSLSFAGQDDPRASQPDLGRVHRPDHDRSLIGNGARLCVS
jgi:hypothetical protein